MKTAVSIPDDVFLMAEKLAQTTKKSRSQLYGDALREYLARHGLDEVTEGMNRVVAQVGEESDGFHTLAARRSMEKSEW